MKSMKIFILLAVLAAAFLPSCRILKPGDNYVSDSDILSVSDDGEFTPAVPGIKASKTIVLSGMGDKGTFSTGENVKIVFDDLDVSSCGFKTTFDNETQQMTMEVVDNNNNLAVLNKKCQTMQFLNVRVVPNIAVNKDLKPEQVVITPLFTSKCEVKGYEVRYGSVERGCAREAADKLSKFNRCVNKNDSRKTVYRPIKGVKNFSDDKKR